jgi:O-succinylbenzoate synthase
VPEGIGSGYAVLRDRIEALTVRRQTVRAAARVMA